MPCPTPHSDRSPALPNPPTYGISEASPHNGITPDFPPSPPNASSRTMRKSMPHHPRSGTPTPNSRPKNGLRNNATPIHNQSFPPSAIDLNLLSAKITYPPSLAESINTTFFIPVPSPDTSQSSGSPHTFPTPLPSLPRIPPFHPKTVPPSPHKTAHI